MSLVAQPVPVAEEVSAVNRLTGAVSGERDMRVVEWLVAGIALLASLLLAFPK